MEIRWAPRAVKDLDHIFKRIERDNPKAARSVIQTIYDGCVSLADSLSVAALDVCKVAVS